MLNIVLFGPPGAGKGTQAERLIESYKLNHISTGDVIRKQIASGSKLGQEMKSYISRGELAPDQLVIDIVADYMQQHNEVAGNIFDGFPRTTHQAQEFDKILANHDQSVKVMLFLDVPDQILVDRLLARGKVSGRADDANEEVIRNRINVYKEQTAVVADYYALQGKYVPIDGVGSIDEIFERVSYVLDNLK